MSWINIRKSFITWGLLTIISYIYIVGLYAEPTDTEIADVPTNIETSTPSTSPESQSQQQHENTSETPINEQQEMQEVVKETENAKPVSDVNATVDTETSNSESEKVDPIAKNINAEEEQHETHEETDIDQTFHDHELLIDGEDDDDDDDSYYEYTDDDDDDDENEETHEHGSQVDPIFEGIAYDRPAHLRPREGGADPGYLQLVLDEQNFNQLMDNNFRNPRESQTHLEKQDEKAQTNGIFVMCYVQSEDELEKRFNRAVQLGEGVYVPLHQMTDFGRHKDFTRGNPALQDVQLSVNHFVSSISEWEPTYFETVKNLKEKTNLKVGGIWFGPPDFEKINEILTQNPNVFDGVYLNWEDGEGSCMNNFGKPPKSTKDGQQTYWANKPTFFFRYYMGGQDSDTCRLPDGRSYIRDIPANAGRELALPDGVTPVFPCFSGNEGLCYKAFSNYIEAACDSTLQRYSFAIYDRYSDRMRLMLEEGCKNIGLPVPPMDFVGAA